MTTLFWGAGATLQFIVLDWARAALGYNLSQASILEGVVALGIAIGAVVASMRVSLDRAVDVIPLGIAHGPGVIVMNFVDSVAVAIPLLVLLGALAGFFVVPMNALLQHRGHNLMGAGRSIAVQNFNENLSILIMIALYSLLIRLDLHINWIILIFGPRHHKPGKMFRFARCPGYRPVFHRKADWLDDWQASVPPGFPCWRQRHRHPASWRHCHQILRGESKPPSKSMRGNTSKFSPTSSSSRHVRCQDLLSPKDQIFPGCLRR